MSAAIEKEMTEQDALNKSRELWGPAATIFDRAECPSFRGKRQDKWVGCHNFTDYKGNHIYGNGVTWDAAFIDAEERQKGFVPKGVRRAWADARARLPAAVPVAILSAPATTVLRGNDVTDVPMSSAYWPVDSATTEVRGKASPEMEELIGRLRFLANGSRTWTIHQGNDLTKLLDHIEGKG